jgi:hypothetical protein
MQHDEQITYRRTRAAKRDEVARRDATKGDAAGDACDVLDVGELLAHFIGGAACIDEHRDGRVSGLNLSHIAERTAEPISEQTFAHRRARRALADTGANEQAHQRWVNRDATANTGRLRCIGADRAFDFK